MFSYIITFFAGIAVGAGLLIANTKCVQRAVSSEKARNQQTIEKLRKENDEVWQERNDLLREKEWNQAYLEGQRSPLTEVEKFADTLEKRKMKLVATNIPDAAGKLIFENKRKFEESY